MPRTRASDRPRPAGRLRSGAAPRVAAGLGAAILAGGCAALPLGGGPEEAPRDCGLVDQEELPALDALLDETSLRNRLRGAPGDQGDLLLTLVVTQEGEAIRIFPTEQPAPPRPEDVVDTPEEPDAESEGPAAGPWLVAIREALREPVPPEAAPGVRVRLVPGPEEELELEPSEYCPPLLRNRAEVETRYRDQMEDLGGVVGMEGVFGLSELGGIRTLEVRMPEEAEEAEIRARRALRFARFAPALVDGRAVTSTVRVRFPEE